MLVILRSLAVIICQRVEVFDLYYSAAQDNWWVVSRDIRMNGLGLLQRLQLQFQGCPL